MGQQISIWVDNECISAPKVNSVITDGIAIISGDFTEKDSAKLAYLIDPERNKFCFSEKSRNITLPTQKEYNEALANVPWVLKTEDTLVSLSMWTLCTFNSASEAYNKVSSQSGTSSDVDFEDQKIGGKDVKDWIYDDAKKNALEYIALKELADKKKLELDDSLIEMFKSYYRQFYESSKSLFSDLGISMDSFLKISTYPSMIKSELFKNLYGKGRELEVKDDELKTYFKENYISYYYVSVDLSTMDADNNTISVSDETKAKYEQFFKKYEKMLNNGNTTDDVTKQYRIDLGLIDSQMPSSVYNVVHKSDISEGTELDRFILGTKEKTAKVKIIDNTIYLVYRFDIREKADKIRDTDGNYDESFIDRDSVLQNMKKDDFEEYIRKAVESLAYETNESSIKNFSVDRALKIIKSNNLWSN